MDADWEVEVGGGAPVIEALWSGFVDLRRNPERLGEIAEAADFPALADLLRALNGFTSPVWTAKCDVWEPAAADLVCPTLPSPSGEIQQTALACYIDLLPVEGQVFAHWQQAKDFCRAWTKRLVPLNLADSRVELIVRQAVAGQAEGFGVTAYLGATGKNRIVAAEALEAAMVAFAGAISTTVAPQKDV
jgi:hypothetical protein